MSAFDRSSEMQMVGIRALEEDYAGDRASVFGEFAISDRRVDAAVATVDEDAVTQRESIELAEPLTGEARGIYDWFGREDSRDPADLYASSPDADEDRALVEDLLDRGFLRQRDDSMIEAVAIPRPVSVTGVEFTTDNHRDAANRLQRAGDVFDARLLVVDEAIVDDALEESSWFESTGIGLASLSSDGVVDVHVDAEVSEPADRSGARALADRLYSEVRA